MKKIAQVCRTNDLPVYLTSGMIKAPPSASVVNMTFEMVVAKIVL